MFAILIFLQTIQAMRGAPSDLGDDRDYPEHDYDDDYPYYDYYGRNDYSYDGYGYGRRRWKW